MFASRNRSTTLPNCESNMVRSFKTKTKSNLPPVDVVASSSDVTNQAIDSDLPLPVLC